MLHFCHYHLIARLHHCLAERGCHQVDALGGATGKYHLCRGAGVDKLPHCFTGSLVQVGGLLRQIVHTPVHIGIDIEVLLSHGIQHAQRFLSGGSIVKIHQRTVIYRARQDGEVLTYGG